MLGGEVVEVEAICILLFVSSPEVTVRLWDCSLWCPFRNFHLREHEYRP